MIAWPIEVLGAYSPNVMENRDSANFALTKLSEVVRRKVSTSLICVMRPVPIFASVGGVIRL
jgi:hypothetical protein